MNGTATRALAALMLRRLRLCVRDGYAELTMKGIATEAGVGRQTVYRWWPAKSDVLLEALRDLAVQHVDEVALTDDAVADMHTVLALTFRVVRESSGPALSGLMADAQHDPGLSRELQSTLIGPRRDALHDIIERGIDAGQLTAAVDPTLVVDMVLGTMWYRLLSHHAPVDDRLATDLVVAIVRLLSPEP